MISHLYFAPLNKGLSGHVWNASAFWAFRCGKKVTVRTSFVIYRVLRQIRTKGLQKIGNFKMAMGKLSEAEGMVVEHGPNTGSAL